MSFKIILKDIDGIRFLKFNGIRHAFLRIINNDEFLIFFILLKISPKFRKKLHKLTNVNISSLLFYINSLVELSQLQFLNIDYC